MDWGYVAWHLTPITAMAVAIFVYAGALTWFENRRQPAKDVTIERKAA